MTCYLMRGKADIKNFMVQTYLKAHGYYKPYNVDGVYGKWTEAEVKHFQSDHKLEADGCVGCLTWNVLVYPPCPWEIKPTPTPTPQPSKNVYVSPRYQSAKQQTNYWCGPFLSAQIVYELTGNIPSQTHLAYLEATTTGGTGHPGLNKGITSVMEDLGHKVEIQWFNYSQTALRTMGEWIADPKVGMGLHVLYKDRWGHYMYPMWLSLATNVWGFVNSLSGNAFSYFDNGTVARWASKTSGGQPAILKVTMVK